MFCKWCGLESDTTDVCSWCRKPFSSPSANTPQQPPSEVKAEAAARPAPEIDNFDDLPPPPAAYNPIVINDEPPAPASPPAAASSAPGGGMPMGDSFDDIDDDLSPFPFGGSGYKPAPLPPRSAAAPPPPTYTPPAQKASTPPPVFNTPPVAPVQPRPQQPVAETPPPPVFTAPPAAPVTARTEPVVEKVVEPAAPIQQAAPVVEDVPPSAAPEVKPEPPRPVPGGMPAYVAPSLPVQADAKPSLEAIPIKLKGPGGAKSAPPPATPIRPGTTPGNRPSLPLSSPGGAPLPASGTTPPPPTYKPVPPAPLSQPFASASTPPAAPVARGPVPLGDVPEEDVPPGPIDLGLRPLVQDDEEESTPYPVPGRRLDTSASTPPTPPPSLPRTGLSAAPPPPARGGRTYYCRWCGMDSDDPQFCSWCKKDLRTAPNNSGKAAHVTVTHGPSKGKPVRQPARPQEQPKGKGQDKKNDRGPKQPLPDLLKEAEKNKANGNGLPKAAPQIGTFQAAKSKYYSDQVYDPVSGAHYDADSGKTTDTPVQPRETVDTNDFVQLGIYAGVFVVLLGLVYWAGSMFGTSVGGYFAVLGIAGFIAGILLPVLRVAPFPKDEDGGDIGWAMGLIPLFGPFAGSMGYGVLGVVRQDVSPAILGVFITSLLIRCVLDLATGHSLSKMVPFSEMSALVLGAQVMPFINLIGWLCSEVFHKPDE